jgi:predicted RNA-binding protein with PIN domain
MPISPQPALLLVDGYNIIGTWSRLSEIRDRHGLEPARRELIESLINYASHHHYQTRIIFDAQFQKTPSNQERYTPFLSVTFTSWTQTADTYIEKLCASFYHCRIPNPPARLIVATSDRDHQLTVTGYGAEWMSAQLLASEVEKSYHQVKRKQRSQKPSRGRFLFDSLDAQAQQKLARWREGKN